MQAKKDAIAAGKTYLGIEMGSTRIKAVLIGEDHTPLASGGHTWENRLENGYWTYHLEDVWTGIQDSYQKLLQDVQKQYGVELTRVESIGISAMMHGYMPFSKEGELLAPFRTWRNTTTEQAVSELIPLLQFNIPHRWSIAHLDQAILSGEDHVKDIDFLTTLAGYVHWKLTGEKVLGVGDASGVFPIDSETGDFDAAMMEKYQQRIAAKGIPWKLADLLPKVLPAGAKAGTLTAQGAKLLDVGGKLQAGIPLCPPEGDAGTGMVATNSVAPRTGNVSAGTSIFVMIALEKALSKMYPEIDMVTTPMGNPVAMVHCNNCTSEIDAWAGLFAEFAKAIGSDITKPELYDKLYFAALDADKDCSGILSYNYLAGEPITHLEEGRPLNVRLPQSKFNLANVMRSHLYGALGTLKLGLDILFRQEKVGLDRLLGHGGLFKTERVGQMIMAAAAEVPVAVMETAGEGGAWGIALLAAYMSNKAGNESLSDYLDNKVFAGNTGTKIDPDPEDIKGFREWMKLYAKGVAVETAAVESLR